MSVSAPVPDWERLFAAQQQRALTLRSSSAAERRERIRALAAAVRRRAPELREALRADLGKPGPEADLTELFPVLQEARYASRHLARWMRPRRVLPTAAMLGTSARLRHEPLGTSLIVSPWNYPINLSLVPAISAFAAGCPAMLKPSELAPATSRALHELVKAEFAPEDLAVVEGGAETAQRLLRLPFAHFFYTGSGRVAGEIMRAAAAHASAVTLELGGKSPTIVDASADLNRAARVITWAAFANAGQTCITPDYVYVQRDVAAALRDKVLAEVRRVWGADSEERRRNPDYCRIVSERHATRLAELIADARAQGAQILFGGASDPAARYVEPTIVWNPPPESRLMQEEVFGPILPLLPYDSLADVIAAINERPKPLALYLYTRDRAVRREVIERTSSGGVVVNHSMLHFLHERLPFGGVNESGLGSYHGYYGFRAFSHRRAVLVDHWSPSRFMMPPYAGMPHRVISLLLRLLG